MSEVLWLNAMKTASVSLEGTTLAGMERLRSANPGVPDYILANYAMTETLHRISCGAETVVEVTCGDAFNGVTYATYVIKPLPPDFTNELAAARAAVAALTQPVTWESGSQAMARLREVLARKKDRVGLTPDEEAELKRLIEQQFALATEDVRKRVPDHA